MSYIEIIRYENGSRIFNFIDEPNKKYIPDVNVVNISLINKEDIYENKKIHNKIMYLEQENNCGPMINIFFSSIASVKKYVKSNKLMLEEKYGKFGKDYHFKIFLLSEFDSRAE